MISLCAYINEPYSKHGTTLFTFEGQCQWQEAPIGSGRASAHKVFFTVGAVKMWNRLLDELVLVNSVDCLKKAGCVSKCRKYNWLLLFIENYTVDKLFC